MNDLSAAAEPEWSPVFSRGQFSLGVQVLDFNVIVRGVKQYAQGTIYLPNGEESLFMWFATLEDLKQFCLEMQPTKIVVDGKHALDLCLPDLGTAAGTFSTG